ncbi:hypothetical protein AZ09_11445 [Acetobacter aceti 1023]|nr:hypothetical protein AZ09_11445 [Acetobacter aceti 1023]
MPVNARITDLSSIHYQYVILMKANCLAVSSKVPPSQHIVITTFFLASYGNHPLKMALTPT